MSTCNRCGFPVEWTVTKAGKKMPLVPGTSEPHFAICSKPPGWFTREYWEPREAVKNDPRLKHLKIVGSQYRPVQHCIGCDVPPWESCGCHTTKPQQVV